MIEPDVIDALWNEIEPICFITKEQFVQGLEDWEVDVVREAGEIAFVTMVKGPEFHFESFGARRIPITRAMIDQRLDPIMEKFGYVITRTPIAAKRQHRFNLAYGFKETGADEFFTEFRKDKPLRNEGIA